MNIVQRIRYEVDNREVSKTADLVEDLTKANKDLQSSSNNALDGATSGLKDYEGELKKAGRELDSNRTKTRAWERVTDQGGKTARKFGDQISIAGKSLTEISDLLTGAGKQFTTFSRTADRGGKTAARGFFTARAAAIAFQLSIGLILGIIAVLAAALSRSQKVIDGVSDALSVATAVFDVFADRAALVGQAIFEIFTGDVEGAAESYRKALTGVGDELEREIRLARLLNEEQREIRREAILLDAQRAKTNQLVKEFGLVSEDVTRSVSERRTAANQAFTLEQQQLQREISNTERRFAAGLGELEISTNVEEVIQQLGEGAISFEELRDQAGISASVDADVEDLVGIYKELQSQQTASLELQTTLNNRVNTIDQQAQQAYLKALAERQKAEQEFAQSQTQLRDALRASEELSGEEQINLNRQIAFEQIAELERVTREKAAAARVQFDAEEEFALLRIRANEAADKEIAAFRVTEQKKAIDAALAEELAYIDLLSVTGDERLSLEEFQARERVAVQVRALQDIRAATVAAGGEGVDAAVLDIDVQIAALQAEDVATLTANNERIKAERLKTLTDQENIENARVDLIRESSNEELTVEQSKELAKLRITQRGVAARLEILREAGATEAELTLLSLQGDQIQQQIDDLENVRLDPIERLVNKIKDAFKLDDEDLAEIVSVLGSAIENITAGVDSLREAELSRIDTQIEAAQERQEELQSLLEQEQADQERGFANNVSLYESALAEQERLEQEGIDRRLQIQKRAANQQLIIDAAQQASAVTTAATKLIASEASKGLIGLVIGIGALGLLFSTVARAKANAQAFAQAPILREGTDSVEGVLLGPSHEGGGVPGYYNKNGNRYAVEMEGGERVFSRKHNAKFAPLFDAIQKNEVGGMADILAAVGGKPMFNGALGTPVIKVESEGKTTAPATEKNGVHFLKISEKKILRIDETGPVRRMEKINIS